MSFTDASTMKWKAMTVVGRARAAPDEVRSRPRRKAGRSGGQFRRDVLRSRSVQPRWPFSEVAALSSKPDRTIFAARLPCRASTEQHRRPASTRRHGQAG